MDIKSFRDTFCDYGAVTMRGAAKALGCSPMMAYRYYDNKEDVFASLRALWFHRLAGSSHRAVFTEMPFYWHTQFERRFTDWSLSI